MIDLVVESTDRSKPARIWSEPMYVHTACVYLYRIKCVYVAIRTMEVRHTFDVEDTSW
jgi:hypothetical protein